ncbi:MAG: Hpt domain-containing protein [Treponema sp.]|nr:Hpt domain-containing protein [Treponema sp.]
MADDIVYVNVEDGSKRVMNNLKLYVKLLSKFKDDKNFDGIKDCLTAGEMEKAQIFAHTLKGLTANLSLSELYKQCVELEAQIKARSVDPGQLEKVGAVYDQTLAEIDKVIAQNV